MSRPELQAPPEIYYGDTEAEKYTNNTRIQQIQADMTYRALELLNLPPAEPAFLLDIGCGSGLSGEILDEEGYIWAGVDIAPSMLEVALEREVEGDLFLQDIGQGFGFRPGSFDGAIRCVQTHIILPCPSACLPTYLPCKSKLTLSSNPPPLRHVPALHAHSISVIQWLLNAETSHPTSSPPHRLTRFFTTLHSALRNPSRAILQFYPTSDDQVQLITSIAQRAGFGGGLVVDYPNSKKARKVFLCLFVGDGGSAQVPKGLEGDDAAAVEGDDAKENAKFETRRQRESRRERNGKQKVIKGGKGWILRKKDLYRRRGKEGVPHDSKYTGRKRRAVF